MEQRQELEIAAAAVERLEQTLKWALGTVCGCCILGSLAFVDLFLFVRNGTAPLDPAISMLLILATAFLIPLSLLSIWSTTSYLGSLNEQLTQIRLESSLPIPETEGTEHGKA